MKIAKRYYRPNQKSDFVRRGKLMWVLKKKKQQDRINLELMDEVREYKLCG